MDLQTLVGRVRKTIGEIEENGYGTQQPGDGSWDNSQIIGYLNEGLGIMAHDWRKEKLGTPIIVATAGQADFTLPADCLEDGLRSLAYNTGGNSFAIKYVDLDAYQLYAVGGFMPGAVTRYVYTIWGGTIKLWPGAASTTDTITPYYFRLPAKLVAPGNVPEIPERFHQALVFYALRECQNAVEEVNLESDAGAKWERELMRFRMEMSRNQRDKGIRVRGRR